MAIEFRIYDSEKQASAFHRRGQGGGSFGKDIMGAALETVPPVDSSVLNF